MLSIGGVLVCVALLALAAVAPAFRSSDPPQWARRGWVGELVTVAIVSTLAIGIGYLGGGVIGAVQTGPAFLDLGTFVGVLVVAVMLWRRLNERIRTRALEVVADQPARAATAEPRPVITEPSSRAA